MMFRKCLAVGIDELMDIYKGGVLMPCAHIEKVEGEEIVRIRLE